MDRLGKIDKLVKGVQSKLEDVALLADHPEVKAVIKKVLKSARGVAGDLKAEIEAQMKGQMTVEDVADKQLDIEGKKAKKSKKPKKGEKGKDEEAVNPEDN